MQTSAPLANHFCSSLATRRSARASRCPAVVHYSGYNCLESRGLGGPGDEGRGGQMAAHFKPGDCVIYRKQKLTAHPGRHAQDIHPAPNGDTYTYCVPKFYRVVAVQPDHTIVVRTRRGRQ